MLILETLAVVFILVIIWIIAVKDIDHDDGNDHLNYT